MQAGEERLYGLDWLRIGAFALLILYHIGMFFVPWDWHVKTAEPLEWLEVPMQALSPWRLLLLFLISGVASRMLLRRIGSPIGFALTRSQRLLLPLMAGMVIFVVPQAWAELRSQGDYQRSFWQFWTQDYFLFGEVGGLILPTWNHLWFVAYLWLYTLALAPLFSLSAASRVRLQQAFDRLFAGKRLIVLPVALLAAARLLLFPEFGETHALVDDAYAHAVYSFAFFFGVGLAGSAAAWKDIGCQWRTALAMGVGGYGVIVALDVTIAGDSGELELVVARIARSMQAWGVIVGLLGFARLRLHFDGPARRYLTDAIFPFYIAHQTITVLAGFWLTPMRLGATVEFPIILVATVIGCALTYEIGRRIDWLRPFIGLRPVRRKLEPSGRKTGAVTV